MAERRRILLAEISPKIPGNPTYTTWNPSDRAAAISLGAGNLTLSTTATGTAWGASRSIVPMLSGQHYWETTHTYSVNADLVCGLALGSAPLTSKPGDSVLTVCGPDKAGACRAGGATLASTGTVASGSIVRHWFDRDSWTYKIAVNGGAWITVATRATFVTLSAAWSESAGVYAIGGVARASAFDTVSLTAFFGSPFAGFVYNVPDGVRPGIYADPVASTTTLYLGSEGFNTGAADSPASTTYLGRIAGDQDFETEREASCWVWGGQTTSRRGQLVIINADGALDAWAGYDWRDAPAVLYAGYEGDARSSFVKYTTTLIDSIDFTDRLRIALNLVDPLARMDRALQTDLYPDTQANEQLAGVPKPIVWGRPKFCTGVLLDTNPTARDYHLCPTFAGPTYTYELATITHLFDRGDYFDFHPDLPAATRLPLTTSNGGAFSSWSGSPAVPANWTRVGTWGASNDRFLDGGSGTLRCQSSGTVTATIQHAAGTLQANAVYTVAFTATAITTAGTFTIKDSSGTATPLNILVNSTGAKSATFVTGAGTGATRIELGASTLDVTIDNMSVSLVLDWTYYPSTLSKQGFHLQNTPAGRVVAHPVAVNVNTGDNVEYLDSCLTYLDQRMLAYGTTGTGIDPKDVAAVDGAAHYRVADYITQPTTILGKLRDLMDCWTGCAVPRLDGSVGLVRIAEPTSAPVLTLDTTNVADEVIVSLDPAKNLTVRLCGAKNYTPHTDTDFATSAPAALREQMKSTYMLNVTGAAANLNQPVSAAYTAALAAPARPMMLQSVIDLQAEANRVATLWRATRRFYTVKAILGASQADTLEPGQTIRLVWPRYGLSGGKNLLVVGVRTRFFSRRVDLKLWG